MLNPNNDRLDYGQLLAPPDGYKLDFAVGTTYSLDLDALVGACIALGLSEETDSELMKNPICLLEALRSTGDKVALFCEGGQIHMPNKVTALYILLEKMVFQVNTVKNKRLSAYPSFHPKFWLIRYIDSENEPLYRVVILSRNLTFDRSWDVAFYMDGKKTGSRTDKNSPVADFLSFLISNLGSGTAGKEKAKRIKSIIKELQYVQFDTGSREFYDYDFIPTGVKKQSGGYYSITDYPLFQNISSPGDAEGMHEIFIMSPFLSKDVIRYFNDRNQYIKNTDSILITRAMSLGRLKPEDCSNFSVFVMKDAVVDGEMAISENEQQYQKQDIHAKVYMLRKNSDSDLYLGSLNASHNAVYGNIEFMIRLKSKNRYLNIGKLKDSIFGKDEGDIGNPFQQVTIKDSGSEEEEQKNLLDGIIKSINRLNPSAVIKQNEEFYDILVHFGEFDCPYKVTVTPMLSNKTEKLSEDMRFSKLTVTQLSEFYVISVDDGQRTVQRVIMIPTEGMPEDREKEIVSSVVNDKACFYRYIAFLLGDSFVLSTLESDDTGEEAGRMVHAKKNIQIPGLYEKMLQTAATAPERFKEIDYLIKAVSNDAVIPEYFEELYNIFRKAVKL